MRSKTLLFLISIGFALCSLYLFTQLLDAKNNNKRLEDSFATANRNVNYYQGVNGQMAVRINTMELKNHELNLIFPQILKEIENLKIKSKRVNTFSETVIHQDKEIIRELRDSLIYDTIKVKAFDYQDDYYKVSGNITPDSIRMNIHSSDSLIQVVYRGQRRNPKRWIFSRRQLEQVVSCKNPNSSIQYTRFIQIEK